MSVVPRSHRDVIRLLGGPAALARRFGLNPVNTVHHWPKRGIPARYRQQLSEIAAVCGVQITADDWELLTVGNARPPIPAAPESVAA